MHIPGKKFISYKHIQARTPEELEVMMLEISVKSEYTVEFSVPSFNGQWHAWFLYDWSKEVTAEASAELNDIKLPAKTKSIKKVKNDS